MNLGISKEDILFLKALQHEMLTQDTVGQASPRFWVVRGTVREYGVDNQHATGEILLVENEINLNTLEEVYDYLLDNYSYIPYRYDKEENTISHYDRIDKEWIEFDDLESIKNFIKSLDSDNEVEVIGYREVKRIYENTMFLTNKECKEHIQANYYHYPEDAHSYAMTAWRAPQVEKLWHILDKINWNAVETLVDTEWEID